MPLPINVPVKEPKIKTIKFALNDDNTVDVYYEYLPVDTSDNEIAAFPLRNVISENSPFANLPAAIQTALVTLRTRGEGLAATDLETKLSNYDV